MLMLRIKRCLFDIVHNMVTALKQSAIPIGGNLRTMLSNHALQFVELLD